MSDLTERLRKLGADASMHRWGGYFGSRDEVIPVPLALLDEVLAHIEKPVRRRGRPTNDVSGWADDIAMKLFLSPEKHRKEDLLAEAGKRTKWDSKRMKSLRAAVNTRLRTLRGEPGVFG